MVYTCTIRESDERQKQDKRTHTRRPGPMYIRGHESIQLQHPSSIVSLQTCHVLLRGYPLPAAAACVTALSRGRGGSTASTHRSIISRDTFFTVLVRTRPVRKKKEGRKKWPGFHSVVSTRWRRVRVGVRACWLWPSAMIDHVETRALTLYSRHFNQHVITILRSSNKRRCVKMSPVQVTVVSA